MRLTPDSSDTKEVQQLNAEPWMLELLALNPGYVHWGPHEDYMWKESNGWDGRVMLKRWSDMWKLDELNECANFYFSVERASKNCDSCSGSGSNPATKLIADGFYAHSSPTGRGWDADITEDEVDALWGEGRLRHDFKDGKPTAAQVNARQSGHGFGVHDAINRWILVKARARREGVYGQCNTCDGRGYVFTAAFAVVTLTLWMLHPRKGCSRGVEVAKIERDELTEVFAWLREAAQRNADRFSLIIAKAEGR